MSAISRTVTFGNGHYKRFSREVGASSFLNLSLLLQRNKAYALLNMVQYKFSLFYKSRKCQVESAVLDVWKEVGNARLLATILFV